MNADVVRDLHPPRLAAEYAGLGWPELLAAFGLGLLLALAIHAVLRPALRPRTRPPALDDRLATIRTLPQGDRMTAYAALATERGTPLPDAWREALYTRAPAPPPGEVEEFLRRTPAPRADRVAQHA